MNKQEIEKLKTNLNLRLLKSKYRDAFVDVFGEADCMKYIEWFYGKFSRKTSEEFDPIMEKLDSYPSLLDWKSEEADSISIIFGDYLESQSSSFVEISVSFNGKNISGIKLPIDYVLFNPNCIDESSKLIIQSAIIFTRKHVFTSILDDNCSNNKYWISFFKKMFELLKDLNQVAARIEMSVALFGEELVDKALTKCGVLNLKELRYAVED